MPKVYWRLATEDDYSKPLVEKPYDADLIASLADPFFGGRVGPPPSKSARREPQQDADMRRDDVGVGDQRPPAAADAELGALSSDAEPIVSGDHDVGRMPDRPEAQAGLEEEAHADVVDRDLGDHGEDDQAALETTSTRETIGAEPSVAAVESAGEELLHIATAADSSIITADHDAGAEPDRLGGDIPPEEDGNAQPTGAGNVATEPHDHDAPPRAQHRDVAPTVDRSEEPADASLVKPAAENEVRRRRPRGRPFPTGKSGNPKGRPKGARNKATVMLEALFERDAQAIGEKASELAKAGKESMIKLIISRLIPPIREATVSVDIPPLSSPTACRLAKARVAEAAAAGDISITQGQRLIAVIDACLQSFDFLEQESRFEERLANVEMVRLLAKYPPAGDPAEGARRWKSFCLELFELKLSPLQFDRVKYEYYDLLSRAVQRLISGAGDEGDDD